MIDVMNLSSILQTYSDADNCSRKKGNKLHFNHILFSYRKYYIILCNDAIFILGVIHKIEIITNTKSIAPFLRTNDESTPYSDE